MDTYQVASYSDGQEPTSSLGILYEDNHLIAVLKPSGLLLQGDRTRRVNLFDLTKDWIKKKYNKPGNVFLGIVHRLDRPVLGVVVFAKTSKAASRLSEQFRNRSVKKTYWALVEGQVFTEKTHLVHFLKSDDRIVRVSNTLIKGSRRAELFYRLIERGISRSLLEVELITGRKHQIRAQLSECGHPIVGDFRYGASCGVTSDGIALIAKRLEFFHPIKKSEKVILELPDSFCRKLCAI